MRGANNMLNELCVVKICKEAEPTDFGDELAMMNIETGEYFVINAVGREIWNHINGQLTIEEIVEKLVDVYDISIEPCRAQTLDFINEMIDGKLLEVVSCD